jgi:hypothetical protein
MSPLRGFVCGSALTVCSVVSVGSVFSVGSATVDSATPLRFARNDRRLSSCGRSRPRAYALGYGNIAPSGLYLCICSLRLLCRLCGLCFLCGLRHRGFRDSDSFRFARNDRCPSPCAPLLRGRATQRTVTAPATQFPGLTPWVMRISPLRGYAVSRAGQSSQGLRPGL